MVPLAIILAAAVASGDHLRPDSVVVSAYERLAERTLGAGAGRLLEMRELPSFAGEQFVSIVERKDGYRVVAQRARASLWHEIVRQTQESPDLGLPRELDAEMIAIPETETCSGRMTARTFEKLRAVWVIALAQARPDEMDAQGLDGTVYRFTVFDRRGARSGRTRSPEAGTNVGALVALGHALISYACGDSSGRRSPEHDLAKAADALLVRFRLAP